MHPNSIFRRVSDADNLAFAKQRGFGVLSVNGDAGPLVSHVPFVISDDGKYANAHLVRSNPILQALVSKQKAVLAVSGADSYISPDWYGIKDQVPTWNYVAVHLRGELQVLVAQELRAHLDELSRSFEERLAPKAPWSTGKMTPEVLAKMMRMIVPVRLDIASVDGTWKLAQNKEAAARMGAADGVKAAGLGQEAAELAALMREPPA